MNIREQIIRDLNDQPDVPVLILGGGINGAGLLRELAYQGVRALLVDKADFASGATSKSSRMIHGGLRYLEHREFSLVRESLLERNRLLTNAPHYVSPLKTTIPLYSRLGGFFRSAAIFFGFHVRPGSRGSLITRLGLMFYDFVTRKNRRTPKHYLTGRSESLRQIQGLDPTIVATATYWDAIITEAERLCIELIQDARRADPRCGALNYVAPLRVEGDRVVLEDSITGQTFTVRPTVVVNATGAWVDFANAKLDIKTGFMGGTKGSHLVVDCPDLHRTLNGQMVYYQHADGRVCIVFPFMDKVIMGSTDIPVDDPDRANCDDAEVDYMLGTLRGVFPGVRIKREQIVFTFCGVRPLPASNSAVTANISRGHTINVLEPADGRPFPIFSLVGGKWTTFRALAEQTADQVMARLGVARQRSTEDEPIGGGRDYPADAQAKSQWIARVAKTCGIEESRVGTLLERYGTSAEAYLAQARPDDERPLRTLPHYSVGEIERIARDEQVMRLSDLVYRRSTIGLLGHATPEVLTELADVAGNVLNWDSAQRQREVDEATPAWAPTAKDPTPAVS